MAGFRKLERIKKRDNPNVEFYSINVPLKRDEFSEVLKISG